MQPSKHINTIQEDEISIKDLLLKMQGWVRYLRKKWLLIGLFGALGAAIGFIYAWLSKPNYLAELTFVLEENKSSPLGSYSGLASQFGIDLGGASGNGGLFAGENILEFLKSRLIVQKALLSPITVQGKTISLAEFYLQVHGIREKWDKVPKLKAINFPPNPDRSLFTVHQDSALNIIYKAILKKNLVVEKPDKKLSFISVRCLSPDEKFSKPFTEQLVKEATDFYVQTKTQRSKSTVDKLQAKADSIELLLNQKTYSAAATQDLNLNPARNVARVGSELATRDKVVLQTMYAEVVKNLELSRMAMAQETPIIQVVDVPLYPLYIEKIGKLKSLVLGGILGVFLIVLILFIRNLYRSIMA